jgi:hypothetical protein
MSSAARDRLMAAALLPADPIRRATQEAIRRLDLQLELPRMAEPWTWSTGGTLARPVVYAAIVLAAALLLYFFVVEVLPGFRQGRRVDWDEAGGAAGEAARAAQEAAASAADALAREGRFAEAMHVLLLHSLAEIRRRLGEHFADSLTSREILRQARISDGGRESLGEIVSRVERSHFGTQEAGAADYRLCRDSFDRLAASLADEPAR